jgi:RNA polymerase sigma-70 factor (ECF subfamily)
MTGVGPEALQTRPSLLIRLRDVGDTDAWRTFVLVYAPLVHRFGRRHGLQDADAADLTQDVLGEVSRSIRAFEYQPARGRFRDWLLVIMRRRFGRFNERRARCHEKAVHEHELERIEDERIEVEWNEAFNSRVLQVALDRVRPSFQPQTWRAFERVWLENRSAAETAEELSVGIDAVYTAKSRVLKRLSEEVEDIANGFSWLDALESP